MNILTPQLGLLLLLGFGGCMVALSLILRKKHLNTNTFLLADRQIGWFQGGMSIAASWIWAPALFISTQVAYEKGLAGIFWFTAPNVLALLLFAFLGPKIRKLYPNGFTLPQFVRKRTGNERLHRLYLFPYFFYQMMAVTVQLFAGGNLVSLLTGIPFEVVMPLLLAIALSYTLISGLKASITTDVVQMAAIVSIGAVILAMAWSAGGGFEMVKGGFQGIEQVASIFDPVVAFSFGVVTSIGLLAGAIADQQYWQRTFAIKEDEVQKAFAWGGVLFGLVPIGLSMLGFLAANPQLGVMLPDGIDTSMIGVQTVATLLPSWATILFVVMLLAGLSSTLDSGLAAISSLWVTDVSKAHSDEKKLWSARLAIVVIGVLGLAVAYAASIIPGFGLQQLWWIFNTIAACTMGPTVVMLYRKNLHPNNIFWGILVSFVIGVPLFVYANILNNPHWIVWSAVFVVALSTGASLIRKR